MAYVITDNCIKDSLCIEVRPTDCIHPKQDEAGYEAATQTHGRSRGMYRLRRLRSGLHV